MPDNSSSIRIKKLSPLLINQLAAGEVVTRPAAVVKELLENAIDAGASNIEVHITQGGMGMIEVVDDGMGIHPDDMVMAITRHATSKVADVANLHGITTLGFRGEALAATAAVSRLTLTSSHDDSGIGRQLQVAGVLDDKPKLLPVVHNRGTTITVKDLYFNVPARRGNLKSIATEFSHIETIVREVALARADVALTLFHDNKKRLSLSATAVGGNHNSHDNANRLPLSRLEQATGLSLTQHALEISLDLSSLVQQPTASIHNSSGNLATISGCSGWLWPIPIPEQAHDALPKLLYVNGRLVKEPIISNQLRQLAHSAGLSHLGYALYFDLPAEWLNINVHPSKQRIKISPLNNILAHLSHGVRLRLKASSRTQTAATSDERLSDDRQALDHTATSTTFAQPSSSIYSTASRTNRAVQAPKHPYQFSATNQSFESETQTDTDRDTDLSFTPFNPVLRDDIGPFKHSILETARLPICLDVISSLDDLTDEPTINTDVDSKTLPWLLFYHQGQCLLISAAVWQLQLSQLFASKVLDVNILKSASILKDAASNSAANINQQLAIVSTQMSAQDLAVFILDLQALLTSKAMKAIDSAQLVVVMLSSATESLHNS